VCCNNKVFNTTERHRENCTYVIKRESRCSVLQCVAVCCSVLQCVARTKWSIEQRATGKLQKHTTGDPALSPHPPTDVNENVISKQVPTAIWAWRRGRGHVSFGMLSHSSQHNKNTRLKATFEPPKQADGYMRGISCAHPLCVDRLYRSFPAKEPYNSWLFCENWSFFAKEPWIIGLFCGKWSIQTIHTERMRARTQLCCSVTKARGYLAPMGRHFLMHF